MVKIVVVSNSFSGGGAELVSRVLVKALQSERNQCSLVTINDWPDDFSPLQIDTHRVGRKYGGGVFDLIKSVLNFRRIIKKVRPDFALVNCEVPELFSIFLPRSVRRIVVEHTSSPWISHNYLGKFVRCVLDFQGANWVTVSKDMKTHSRKNKKFYQIPNPTVHDITHLGFLNQNINRLLFIGRLVSLKQPEMIINAAQKTSIPALVIGEGSEANSLIAKAKAGTVQIDFVGVSQNPWRLAKEGDLLIVPSKFEGDGLVVSEAIITGMPILLFDVPDLRRFNLPDLNYFASQEELNSKVLEYTNRLNEFVTPISIRETHVQERLPINVARRWEALIGELSINP